MYVKGIPLYLNSAPLSNKIYLLSPLTYYSNQECEENMWTKASDHSFESSSDFGNGRKIYIV